MKHKLIPIVLAAALITGCTANTTEETIKEEPTTESTVEATVATSTGTVEETTEQKTTLVLEQTKLDGVLPDGEYFVMITSFDEDASGATFDVNGYWTISEVGLSNLVVGDAIVMGEGEFEVTACDPSAYYAVTIGDLYGTEKQRTGEYYIRGMSDEIMTYPITTGYHINFADNMEIYNDVEIYGAGDIVWNESTEGMETESSFKYNDVQDYIRDVTETGSTTWGCHIVVVNGIVQTIYTNPTLHQAWMTNEVWQKYYA